MTFKQRALYFIIALCVMIGLAIADYFVLGFIVSLFTASWFAHTLIICLAVVLVNPVLCKIIMEKMPFEAKNLKKQKIKKTNPHNIKA